MPRAFGLLLPGLQQTRRGRAITQLELAEKAGVTRSTVTRAEAGERVSLPSARKLATALDVSIDQLLMKQ